MIEAVGHRVILKIPKTVEKDTETLAKDAQHLLASGFQIVKDSWQTNAEEFASQEGFVYSIGPTAWSIAAYGGKPWVEVGDHVLIGKYTGKLITDPTDPDSRYMVVNDEDILARINNG